MKNELAIWLMGFIEASPPGTVPDAIIKRVKQEFENEDKVSIPKESAREEHGRRQNDEPGRLPWRDNWRPGPMWGDPVRTNEPLWLWRDAISTSGQFDLTKSAPSLAALPDEPDGLYN